TAAPGRGGESGSGGGGGTSTRARTAGGAGRSPPPHGAIRLANTTNKKARPTPAQVILRLAVGTPTAARPPRFFRAAATAFRLTFASRSAGRGGTAPLPAWVALSAVGAIASTPAWMNGASARAASAGVW